MRKARLEESLSQKLMIELFRPGKEYMRLPPPHGCTLIVCVLACVHGILLPVFEDKGSSSGELDDQCLFW